MSKSIPLVSVVMPTFNSENFVAEALKSVINQTYSNFEVIIVDDASTDNTVDVISQYVKNDSRIILEQLRENSGAAVARNKAIEKARGDYIAFLDSDDKWLPNKLEMQLKLFKDKKCAVVFSSYHCMDEQGLMLDKCVTALPKLNFQKILKCNYIGNLTGMYSVEKLGKIYAPNIRKRQDWGLWISAIDKAGFAYGIAEPLAVYRERENSISSNKIKLVTYNFSVYKDFLNYSYLKSTYFMMLFLYQYFFVKPKNVKTSKK